MYDTARSFGICHLVVVAGDTDNYIVARDHETCRRFIESPRTAGVTRGCKCKKYIDDAASRATERYHSGWQVCGF